MNSKKIEILERTLERERKARKAAEKILEEKSLDLYNTSIELKKVNHQLENLLNEKTIQLQGVFENINDAYVVMDLFGNVLKMNNIAKNLFGYDIDKESLNVTDLIYPEDYNYAISSYQNLKNKGKFSDYTARVITKTKDVKWVHINASVIFDKEKKPIAAQGIIRDITLDIQSKNLLQESENRLSSLLLNLESGVLLEDENRKIILTNKKFCEFFQIPVNPETLKGQDCTKAAEQSKNLFKKPDDFVNNINALLKDKKQVLGEELIMQNGTILERDFIPIILENKYKGHLWTYRDVTLQKRYNQIIESEKIKYSSIIANMNLGLLEVNTEDKILFANNSFCKMSGYSEEELVGKVAKEIFLSDKDKAKIKNQDRKRANGESNSYEIDIVNKKGESKTWLISGAPNYNVNGELIGSIGVHLDITQLKVLEAQKAKILKELENSNKDLEEYAHIVSHDLKSPLRSIDALISWIKSDNEGNFDEMTLQNFDLIATTLETMEKLISNVLEYSSAGATSKKFEDVDLNKLLNNLKQVLFIPDNINLTIPNTLPVIKGDATKFQQLFQNFISNAIKFCDKEKGIVEIGCKEEPTFYQFSVRDNGIGIEKKYHDKIFQVFHSLQKRKDSSGIGLSIVKKIVDLYKGDIWLESKVNEGTTFYFTIKKY
jgi:PAS domain S-box-containing protein